MKIPAIYSSNRLVSKVKKEQNNEKGLKSNVSTPISNELHPQFNDYLLAFGARVDKDMNRFYNVNKDRMPLTVRELVEPMPNRALITPLEAQYYAFRKLEDDDVKTVEDIKKAYPNEPLFKTLKDVSELRATKGLLYSVREMKDLYPESVLQSGENLTVYLVKKLFLEAKTLGEINEDLDDDLDPDFKVYYNGEKPDSNYILPSTLLALGIQLPDSKYLTSLRYTRDGYSDMMGRKISKGLEKFINSLTPEQRTARAVRSTREFEKWWNQFTTEEKIELIANKEAQLEMLKLYKRDKRADMKRLREAGIAIEDAAEDQTDRTKKTHTKVGSKELSSDELFKMWATLNIKTFEAGLSQAEMDTLHLRRMAHSFRRWQEMTSAERTDYISKMKAGSEPIRYTMIDAWNKSPEIIKALYLHLKENQVYKPADLLYSTDEFSQHQSKVMTEFWDKNPKFGQLLGDRIHLSREKIENAIRNGNFEELKIQINRDKNQRKRELEAYKKSLEIPEEQSVVKEADYKDDFRKAYFAHQFGVVQSVPKKYFQDVYESLLENLPEDVVRLWTKNLKGQELTAEEVGYVKQAISEENNPGSVRYSRAFEAAMADSIYSVTGNPKAYELSVSDEKVVMYHIERGENPIVIQSYKNKQEYIFEIKNKKRVDTNRINNLYEMYKRDLSSEELSDIVDYNFDFIQPDSNEISTIFNPIIDAQKLALCEYIKSYGKSANILFSDKSAYPADVKAAFANKFMVNMPKVLRDSNLMRSFYTEPGGVELDTKLAHTANLFGYRFNFLPKDFVQSYFKEFGTVVKRDNAQKENIDEFLYKLCKKRVRVSDHGSVAVIAKHLMVSPKIKCQMLAMEQAMADVLYDACKNPDVYAIAFEHLCDKLELFSLVKNFPSETSMCPMVDGEQAPLVVHSPIKVRDIQKKYNDYMHEINKSSVVNPQTGKVDYEELLYILNPEEQELPAFDRNVKERMGTYFPDLSEADFPQ